MKEHEFTLVLAKPEESEDDAETVYTRCNDASICTSEGITRIDFHRDAASLEQAIRSAIADVQQAGFQVARVEMEPGAIAQTGG